MKKFREKPHEVTAVRWFANGDHPLDGGDPDKEGKVVRRYRHPMHVGSSPCIECGLALDSHGWIDGGHEGWKVCPGDWVVTTLDGDIGAVKPDVFAGRFEPVPTKADTVAQQDRDLIDYLAGQMNDACGQPLRIFTNARVPHPEAWDRAIGRALADELARGSAESR